MFILQNKSRLNIKIWHQVTQEKFKRNIGYFLDFRFQSLWLRDQATSPQK